MLIIISILDTCQNLHPEKGICQDVVILSSHLI